MLVLYPVWLRLGKVCSVCKAHSIMLFFANFDLRCCLESSIPRIMLPSSDVLHGQCQRIACLDAFRFIRQHTEVVCAGDVPLRR